jgi:RNA-directed DNA polymerase
VKAYEWAYTGKGHWRTAGSWILSTTLTNAYWRDQGLQGFAVPYRRFRDATRTAGCGPACPVVWEAPG